MRPVPARALAIVLPLAGIALLILLPWLLAVRLGVRPVVLPTPWTVARTASELGGSKAFHHAVLVSLMRVNSGFALAAITAIPLGIVLGRHPRLYAALEGVVESFRYVIPFAWIPLAILWFGVSEGGKLFIIWYAGFFIMLLQTMAAVRSVDETLVKAALTLGAGRVGVLTKVVLPATLPQVIVGMRIAFATCWISILAAELVAARSGLGYLVMDARELLQTDVVIVGMAAIGCIGVAYNGLFLLLQRRFACHEGTGNGVE